MQAVFREDNSHAFENITLTRELIFEKFKNLKVNKAPGIYDIVRNAK